MPAVEVHYCQLSFFKDTNVQKWQLKSRKMHLDERFVALPP